MLRNLDKYLIIALGLFSIAWGLFWLYKPLFLSSGSQYNIFEEIASGNFSFNSNFPKEKWFHLPVGIFIGYLFVRAGIGLIKIKLLAVIEFWMAMPMHLLFSSFGIFHAVGWSGNEIIIILNTVFILFSSLLFLWPKFYERFPHQEAPKWMTNFPYVGWQLKKYSLIKRAKLQLMLLIMIFGSNYYIWEKIYINDFPPLRESQFTIYR